MVMVNGLYKAYLEFWQGYISTLCFTASSDETDPETGNSDGLFPQDITGTFDEIYPNAWSIIAPHLDGSDKQTLQREAENFFEEHHLLFNHEYYEAGSCFLYVRNGHGISFQDNDMFGDHAQALDEAASCYSGCNLAGLWHDEANQPRDLYIYS